MVIDYYGVKASPPCRSVLMTAKLLGLELNHKALDMQNGEHLKPEFLKLNPQHTIPTIVDNGFAIWESRAIITYLAEKYGKDDSLYPKCPQKRAIVNQRLFFDLGTLYQSFGEYFQPIREKKQPDPEKLKKLQTAFELLNTFLEGQTYVAGDNLTVADISLVAAVSTINVLGFDYSNYTNVTKWYEHLQKDLPNWQENWDGCLALKEYIEKTPHKPH